MNALELNRQILEQDSCNPFKYNIFTPNPSGRCRDYWGFVLQTTLGQYRGHYYDGKSTLPFHHKESAALALMFEMKKELINEDLDSEYDQDIVMLDETPLLMPKTLHSVRPRNHG